MPKKKWRGYSKKRSKNRKSYSAAEKKSFRAGFLRGLFSKKKKNSSKKQNARKKSVRTERQNIITRHNVLFRDEPDYLYAYRYAKHMGFKFSLDDETVLKNASAHFEQMKKDSDFAAWLRDNYG